MVLCLLGIGMLWIGSHEYVACPGRCELVVVRISAKVLVIDWLVGLYWYCWFVYID